MAEDPNELADLVGQIQEALSAVSNLTTQLSSLSTEHNKLRAEFDKEKERVDKFRITDDSGVFSGQGPEGIKANFSNLPDPIVTATVDCETDPPTLTINVTT